MGGIKMKRIIASALLIATTLSLVAFRMMKILYPVLLISMVNPLLPIKWIMTGMSQQQALQSTPDSMKTTGEMQTQTGMQQGYIDQNGNYTGN